jgi:hypothetical protein
VEVAAEKNSTLVLPFPVELLRFLERATGPAPESSASRPAVPAGRAVAATRQSPPATGDSPPAAVDSPAGDPPPALARARGNGPTASTGAAPTA